MRNQPGRRGDAPLTVDIPSPERDTPGWVKVGVIAALGFVIGIAWPRLVGVKLGPSSPSEAASAASASKAAARLPEAPTASVVTAAKASGQPSAAPVASAAPAGPPQINVLKGAIITCKTDDGDTKKGKDCGAIPSLDQVVVPRLRKIASCAGAEGQTGKLSFVANADYGSGKFGWEVGKSSTVGNVDQLTTCLKTHFQGVSVAGPHDNARYSVSYTAVFTAPPAPKEDKTSDPGTDKDKSEAKTAPPDTTPKDNPKVEEPKTEAASGEATVAWEVALVRDVPKTGQVVARLPRGAKVKLGSVKDGWYAIKYGENLASDGWVYRGAIGR